MVEFLNTVPRMSMVPTQIIKQPWDVDRRLAELTLDRPMLLKVREVALSAAADATAFHPANAAGTFAYQHGTWALRDGFVGEIWELARPGGVEAICNQSLLLMVAYANVDTACVDDHCPKPRSRKGAAAERVGTGNLFGTLPHYAPEPKDGGMFYYLMVDETGAAELSRPVVKSGTFTSCIERIYLSDGDDLDRIARPLDDSDVANDFDPLVARK
jgi:hypothetical protein